MKKKKIVLKPKNSLHRLCYTRLPFADELEEATRQAEEKKLKEASKASDEEKAD